MRVLLDEQMPKGLVAELAGHEVRTVGQLGWKGLDNGELLTRAAERFDGVTACHRVHEIKKLNADDGSRFHSTLVFEVHNEGVGRIKA